MKNLFSTKHLFFTLLAVLLLIVIAYLMGYIIIEV